MSDRISDCPPLFPAGEHVLTMEQLREKCVDAFPISKTRQKIMAGFEHIFMLGVGFGIIGDLVIDGSFLTEEIDPDDIDFAVVVSPEFYDHCDAEQREFLEWIRDDFSIRDTNLCDCYLCVEWPAGHEQYFDGLQNREYWVKWYSKSTVLKRDRGVAIVNEWRLSARQAEGNL